MNIPDDLSEYRCPKCGFLATEESLIRRSEPEYNHQKCLTFGGHPLDWMEYHICPFCEIEFSFENSNC